MILSGGIEPISSFLTPFSQMYQHAAACAYEHALRLAGELPGVESLPAQLHGYLSAISCLQLLREQDVSK